MIFHGLGGRRERCSCHCRHLLLFMSVTGDLLLDCFWHLQRLHALRHQTYSLWHNTLEGGCGELCRPILDWLDHGWWGWLLQLHSVAEALLYELLLEVQSFEHHSVATAEWGRIQVGSWRRGGFGRCLLVLIRFRLHLFDRLGRGRLEL